MIGGLPVTLSLLYLSPSCIVFMPLKKLPSFILTLAVGCFYTTPHEKASGFRNQRNFCLSNPKSRKFLILDSGIVCIEIRKTAQGIWIPSNDCNPESKLSCTDEVWNPVPGIPNPARPGFQNPSLSWIPLHGANFQCWLIFCSHLEDSLIVGNSINYVKTIRSWLSPVARSVKSAWKLCWRASVDGWAARTFHSRCDGKGPTVTIIRVGKYIFGGYTSSSWGE